MHRRIALLAASFTSIAAVGIAPTSATASETGSRPEHRTVNAITYAPTVSAKASHADGPATRADIVLPPPIDVTGVITTGVERGCVALREDKTGDWYELIDGKVDIPPAGTRVKIHGQPHPELTSYCMQGTMLEVLSVEEPPTTN